MSQSTTHVTRPTTSKPRQVIATVTRFFEDKGFGFAEISGERSPGGTPISVFFHKSACRKVEGTADAPELTREHNEEYISGGGRNPSRLVMLIVPSDKGLKAIAWGSVPRRNWRSDLINLYGGLDRFVGGEFTSERSHGGFFSGPEYRGITTAIVLTVERVEITITQPRLRDENGRYRLTGEESLTLTYDLEFARPIKSHHSYRIDVPEGSRDNRLLVFMPPSALQEI